MSTTTGQLLKPMMWYPNRNQQLLLLWSRAMNLYLWRTKKKSTMCIVKWRSILNCSLFKACTIPGLYRQLPIKIWQWPFTTKIRSTRSSFLPIWLRSTVLVKCLAHAVSRINDLMPTTEPIPTWEVSCEHWLRKTTQKSVWATQISLQAEVNTKFERILS